MKNKRKPRNAMSYAKLLETLSRHKRVKVVIAEVGSKDISRERILTAKGSSLVRYYSTVYRHKVDGTLELDKNKKPIVYKIKKSRYHQSCFQGKISGSYADEKLRTMRNRAKAVVTAMQQHDGSYLLIKAVYVGKGFKRKVA